MTDEEKAPCATGRLPEAIELTGKLIPWYGMKAHRTGQPALLSMPGSPSLYLPCFSTEEKLRIFLAEAKVPFESIKMIENGVEFLDGIRESPEPVEVILDPYFLPNGHVRFMQVLGSN